MQTDISLSQFLAIQEKGVSAWEFEPELEIANCFVEARTEIEFFDSECSVQSNLPIPKQNEVYYFEAKIYDKPETSLLSIGVTTKPYPLFRLPGVFLFAGCYILLANGNRLAQGFNSVHIRRSSTIQPTVHTHPVRPGIRARRCHRCWIPTAHRNRLLHSKWQEARRRRAWPQNPKLLPHRWRRWPVYRACQFWTKRVCVYRSQRQEMGLGSNDWKSCATTAVRK